MFKSRAYLCFVFLGVAAASWAAQTQSTPPAQITKVEPRPVDSIVSLRRGDLNEAVSVIGFVDAERRVTSRSFKGYYLKDRFGAQILVRTLNPLPEMLTRLVVTGVLLEDLGPVPPEKYIVETGRVLQPDITKQPEVRTEVSTGTIMKDTEVVGETAAARLAQMDRGKAGQAMASIQNQPQAESGFPWQLAIAVGALLLFAIAVVAVIGGSRRKPAAVENTASWKSQPAAVENTASWKSQPAAVENTASWKPEPAAVPTPPPDVEQFKTMRVFKTTRIIPVSLEVLQGDVVVERIPLYDQNGEGVVELGRDVPGATQGVRIKDPSNTLSRNQARISIDRATRVVRVTNLAPSTSNSTVVNGQSLREQESIEVKTGDRIQMGAVVVRIVTA